MLKSSSSLFKIQTLGQHLMQKDMLYFFSDSYFWYMHAYRKVLLGFYEIFFLRCQSILLSFPKRTYFGYPAVLIGYPTVLLEYLTLYSCLVIQWSCLLPNSPAWLPNSFPVLPYTVFLLGYPMVLPVTQ